MGLNRRAEVTDGGCQVGGLERGVVGPVPCAWGWMVSGEMSGLWSKEELLARFGAWVWDGLSPLAGSTT